MRAGTAGSAVLGTIHGNSSRSVYDRIVHDLQIPPLSFTATDIVVIAGLARPGGTQRFDRRVTEITEVAKSRGPGEFESLMGYQPENDALEATETYRHSSERVRAIAESWGLSYADALENIEARAAIREALVATAVRRRQKEYLSAPWVTTSNAKYWSLVEEGFRGKEIVDEWTAWLARAMWMPETRFFDRACGFATRIWPLDPRRVPGHPSPPSRRVR